MMKPLLFLAFFMLAAMRPGAGFAQDPTAPATQSVPALTAAQAQQALDMLQDPQKRERLISLLQTAAKAAPATAPAAEPAPAPAASAKTSAVSLKPHSLGAQLLMAMSKWTAQLAGEAAATLETMNKLPELWRWLVDL